MIFKENYKIKRQSGGEVSLLIKIDEPYKNKEFFYVDVYLDGLIENLPPIGGPSKMRAIENSFIFVRELMHGFVAKGNTVYLVGSNGILEVAYFD